MSFASPVAWYWVIAPLAVIVLAILLLLRGLSHLLFGRMRRGGFHLAASVPLALTGLAVGLVVLNTQSFARLTHERAVADVEVAALDAGAQRYRVTVRRLDGTDIAIGCVLQGDEWEVSARVQKWRPWANILGLDSTYALDQVANKYASAARGNGRVITACDLAGAQPSANAFVPSGILQWLLAHSYAEHRRFGSAVYMPLADGALYRVTMTQSGLNAEAVNPIAQAAVLRGI